jgi:hypothetical protein
LENEENSMEIYATKFSIEEKGEVKAELEMFGEAVDIVKIEKFPSPHLLRIIADFIESDIPEKPIAKPQ